jgi:DNA-binding MurR/RpiR family transcriptional regulator
MTKFCNHNCKGGNAMNLRQVVAGFTGNLSVSEQTVIQEVLKSPTEAAFLSATELAERSGVHAATVVRLAQKLGYKGYPEMRQGLANEFRAQQGQASNRVKRSLERSSQSNILSNLLETEISTLQTLAQNVNSLQLEEAAKTLAQAKRILLFASGHATALIELLDRRLRRAGYQTLPICYQGRELAERLIGVNNNDVLVAFALRQAPKPLPALLEYLSERGAKSIVIADSIGLLLRPQPDLLLCSPRGDGQSYQTLTVPMTILNALVLTLAQHDSGRSIKALSQLEPLLERFTEEV